MKGDCMKRSYSDNTKVYGANVVVDKPKKASGKKSKQTTSENKKES